MRSIRKLALAGLAALMLCAMVAASASAAIVTGYDSVTNANLAAGSSYNIQSTGGSTLTGSFFGFGGTTISCTGFSAVGAVQHNPGFSATVTSAKFTGCKNQNNAVCTSGTGAAAGEMVAFGLGWTPGTSTAPGGGIVGNALTQVYIGTGPNGYFQIPGACTPTGSACNVQPTGANQSDGAVDHYISKVATATWTNSATGQATITGQAVGSHSSTNGCITSGSWSTAKSIVRTGATVGAGNAIFLK